MLEPLLRSFKAKLPGYCMSQHLSLKYLAYADDTLIFLNTPADLEQSKDLYHRYSIVSNAKLNDHKTQGVMLAGKCDPWKLKYPEYQCQTLPAHPSPKTTKPNS
ncbi:hypothetical protein K450DRAFT_283523 [Umbelopsis ramanniana AG]|uniref:Reverse transcriptase domain-containing protein n=1 Tax=Umbelopsis ramanniana AG TaxID=1314678 RepID=A0AAD5E407_UMBRA|nr:uncharacterized protein K450DRAFT_283523 [Umbelopsis ramanniana AG]KAI8576324.1 hypothetical protein K450DRAFT_283523 [Umbelopsis ramanniana AG]